MHREYTTALYDYTLNKELVAQHPLPKRDASRLLVLHRAGGEIEHRSFPDIVHYLRQGDAIVLNNSKVIPARLIGSRITGGSVKVLLVEKLDVGRWRVLLETRGKPVIGEEIQFDGGPLAGTLLERLSAREWVMGFGSDQTVWKILDKFGKMPLPPYINRPIKNDPFSPEDRERYQSVFASKPGSIAAPTAGLHFTQQLLEEIARIGVAIINITLHVSLGTFTPVRSSVITRHKMEKEYYELGTDAARRLNDVRDRGGRVVAVGSTCCRVLETLTHEGRLKASKGWTDLFIYPPYRFKMVDMLLTNFHLPKTTLLVLVSAFADRDKILDAYEEAKKKGYRFYSYGDAMLIV
ncbi:MAG: tRNA preQ1(34) S-adenosylmethionine ribosyltransferase-isomerase QueA [Candidatus Brocadiales bacterium]